MNNAFELALNTFDDEDIRENYIFVNGSTVTFKFQSDPLKVAGKNGIDVSGAIEYLLAVYRIFNDRLPCEENSMIIKSLEQAMSANNLRTKDRVLRNVEGTSKD